MTFWRIVLFGMTLGVWSWSVMASKVKGVSESFSQANAKFTEDFYREISKDGGNVFFSPVSISMAFAMLELGARGNTSEQIHSALSLNTTKDIHKSFSQLHGIINSSLKKAELLTANRLFVSKSYEISAKYLEDTMKYYKAEAQNLDFNDEKTSAGVINKWVEEKTNNKIKDLIKDIDPMTALILVNAIYFKGQWQEPFDKNDTKTAPFYLNDKDEIQHSFMFKEETDFPVGFDKKTNSIILELPYSDEDLSMVILLPKERNGLKKLEENLPGRIFPILCERRYPVEVILKFPKFKFESEAILNSVMQSLGIEDAFVRGKADLSGIGPNLYVSKAVHKAFVEVNEEGTEAAAATGMVAVNYSLPPPPKRIDVDHPFLFAIVEKSSKTVLFFGRVMKPVYEE